MNKDLWKNGCKEAKSYTKQEFRIWVDHVFKDFSKTTRFEISERDDSESYWIETRDKYNWRTSTYIFNRRTESAIFINGAYTPIVIKLTKKATYITNLDTGKHGSARLSPDDSYDLFTAIAIAWARYCKIPIPGNIKFSINDLRSGDVFYMRNRLGDIVCVQYVGKNPLEKDEHIILCKNAENISDIGRYFSVPIDEDHSYFENPEEENK